MATRFDLQGVLSRHVGKHSGVTATALSVALGCTVRAVRHLVTELREEGVPVCGHPRTGYFVAANEAELQETCAFLRSRAMHSLVLEAKLNKIPLPELLGQLKLPT